MHRRWFTYQKYAILIVIVAGCDGLQFGFFTTSGGPIDNLVVFGDSLSDVGNIQQITAGLIPLPPYANGRFSNGEIWVDLVGAHFGVPALASQRGGTIYAVGGATTERDSPFAFDDDFPVNLRQQVGDYLSERHPQVGDVFVIWAGGNDVFDMVRGIGGLTPQRSADNVLIAVILLYNAGARDFVIVNTPDVQETPRFRESPNRDLARALVQEVNDALADHVAFLSDLTNISIVNVQADGVLSDLILNPPAGVIEPVEQAWSGSFEGFLGDGRLVPEPDTHLFFDNVHPTRRAHAVIAELLIDAISDLIASRDEE